MGELADELIDNILNADWWEHDYSGKVCKRCGADELYWEEARGPHNRKRWVLMERTGQIHVCPDAPSAAAADEFPIEPTNNDKPIPQNSAVRARSKTHDSSAKSRRSRAIQPKLIPALGTVRRKHGVSRKSGKRR